MESLAERIEEEWACYQQQLPDLRSWFLRFDGLLVDIDVACPESEVLSTVKSHVQRISEAKGAAEYSRQSSQAAQTALEVKQILSNSIETSPNIGCARSLRELNLQQNSLCHLLRL